MRAEAKPNTKALFSRLNLILVATLLFSLRAVCATVSLPYYDGFNYSEGNLNAVSVGNWVAGNGTSTFEIAVSNSAALNGPSNYLSATGRGVRRAPSGSARRSVLQYVSQSAIDGKALFISFQMNVQAAP